MIRASKQREREKAWTATKLAVRAYSRDPSQANADKVRTACVEVRRLAGSAQTRGRAIARHPSA